MGFMNDKPKTTELELTYDQADLLWSAVRCYLRNSSDCQRFEDERNKAEEMSKLLHQVKSKLARTALDK